MTLPNSIKSKSEMCPDRSLGEWEGDGDGEVLNKRPKFTPCEKSALECQLPTWIKLQYIYKT